MAQSGNLEIVESTKCAYPGCPHAGQIDEGQSTKLAGNGKNYHTACYDKFRPDLAVSVISMPAGNTCELCLQPIKLHSPGAEIIATGKSRHMSCHLKSLPTKGIKKTTKEPKILDASGIRQGRNLINA